MALTTEQSEMQQSVRELLARLVSRELLDDVERGSRPATTDTRWKKLTDVGLPGLFIPEHAGGSGASNVDVAVIAAELGRVLCPDPIMTVWDATEVLLCAGTGAKYVGAVAAGAMRPVLAVADEAGCWSNTVSPVRMQDDRVFGDVVFVEAADVATHFIVRSSTGSDTSLQLVAADDDGVLIAPMDAMVGRWWWRVEFRGARATQLTRDWNDVRDARWPIWMRIAAWCGGASQRLIEDTADYAKKRVQFGVPIGSFQAVQHNLASAAIAAAEVNNLAFTAAAALDAGETDAALLSAAAVTHGGDGFVSVARRCHQTWGGVGFCTESHVHHFSRRAKLVQQSRGGRPEHLEAFMDELTKAGTIRRATGTRGDTDGLARFRAEVREFACKSDDPVIAKQGTFPQGDTPEKRAFIRRLGERGWLGLAWPHSYGGAGLDARFQLVLQQELEYYSLPSASIEVGMVGPTLLRHGSDELKKEFLSRITRGELNVALGYSEPNAGSDLAALSLRAERKGDEYVLNGQKMYTSAAHFADVIWLACRTGGPGSGHRGISILIVDADAPGISISELATLGTHRTNVVYFDDVHVPVARRVGAENEGWRYIMEALDLERLTGFPTGGFLRDTDRLIEWYSENAGARTPEVRRRIAEIALRSLGAFSHAEHAMDVLAQHGVPTADATMLKVAVTEARQEHADAFLALMGPRALLRGENGILAGHFEEVWRDEIITTIAGGANEIQRNIIAQRLLGLPRQ
ncbi:acyl-CoA dehydrogenase [Mycolicibacterium pulveris]|uniref:Acyl-CoA dehydrogenase n=1 Tax=Mycolicibacterium pulveris TaxID=36813 RepID=A0A7I7UPQ0_MYCPV|nr:acyl-CoA dehydrogenase [Mycolicibacterium pulveris]MCV6983526.1 acyl-CoA dehydrogenase [Mycolicibacterium pulveris]BBY83405.1 hypothetical protein MPUL_45630 [Mycolicibacterium pulveris]